MGFAIAKPEAAIALARPVGFRAAVDRRQGRFFSLTMPLGGLLVILEMTDTESVSLETLSVDEPFVPVLSVWALMVGKLVEAEVGDSTMGVMVTFMETSCPWELSSEV